MKKLIGWQIYTVALMAAAYSAARHMGAEQAFASVLAMCAVLLSSIMLAVCVIPAVFSAFMGTVLFAALTEFAMLASYTATVGFTVATLLNMVLVIILGVLFVVSAAMKAASVDAPLPRYAWVSLSYALQSLCVSLIILP